MIKTAPQRQYWTEYPPMHEGSNLCCEVLGPPSQKCVLPYVADDHVGVMHVGQTFLNKITTVLMIHNQRQRAKRFKQSCRIYQGR